MPNTEIATPVSDLRVSFEFFPPKSEQMAMSLWQTIRRLEPLNPDFVSVTYGAGGTTREPTLDAVARIRRETSLAPAAHLTCVGASKEDVNHVIRSYKSAGIQHVVALRGDPAAGVGAAYEAHPDGYQTTDELVRGIRDIGDFDVFVSAYPEKHPESPSWQHEIDVLKRKVDAGATRAITQFFFYNDLYESYVDRVRAAGINIPIVPGILPILNYKQVASFAERCGTAMPTWLAERYEGLDNDLKTRELIAAAYAAEQVQDLHQRGVRDFHFYTMNRAELTYAICWMIGVRPNSLAQAA
ncbi:methylenetetrahydrofolate reductase [NAD(P)H] [Coralliovum pocilloporae]|uniref:methylenetetrahydrofolate reductase [NAD(P)H] n=1 Tax=Coralliovum pocilloporae TaxID=3066369 RepID=UPI00330733F3